MGVYTWDISCADARGPFIAAGPFGPGRARKTRAREARRAATQRREHADLRGARADAVHRGAVDSSRSPGTSRRRPSPRCPTTIRSPSAGLHCSRARRGRAALGRLAGRAPDGGPPGRDGRRARLSLRPRHRRRHRHHRRLHQRRRLRGQAPPRRLVRAPADGRPTARGGHRPEPPSALPRSRLLAYEDWSVDGELVGLPMLVSNPSVAFEGVVRGLALPLPGLSAGRQKRASGRRCVGSGTSAAPPRGAPTVPGWIASSPGVCPSPSARTRASGGGASSHCRRSSASSSSAPASRRRATGRASQRRSQTPRRARAPSLRRPAVARDRPRSGRRAGDGADQRPRARRASCASSERPGRIPPASRDGVADEALARWPYRSLDHLLAAVPGARGLRRLKSGSPSAASFRKPTRGRLRSLAPRPKEAKEKLARPARSPTASCSAACRCHRRCRRSAARTFPTFEAYMDAALHDPQVGLLRHGVADRKWPATSARIRRSLSPLRPLGREAGLSAVARDARARRALRNGRRSRSSSSARATGASPGTSSTHVAQAADDPKRDDRERQRLADLRVAAGLPDLRDVGIPAGPAAGAPGPGRHRRRRGRPPSRRDAEAGLSRRRQGSGAHATSSPTRSASTRSC